MEQDKQLEEAIRLLRLIHRDAPQSRPDNPTEHKTHAWWAYIANGYIIEFFKRWNIDPEEPLNTEEKH